MATSSSTPSIAILDDYADIARSHFSNIPSSKLKIDVYKDTLPFFNHPATTDADRQKIVSRLQPYPIISTMRERTPFPKELLAQLPNLKLLLVTGSQFQTFDIPYAKEKGVKVVFAPGKGKKGKRDIKKGGAHSTTQHTWAMILALVRNVATDDWVVKTGARGGWQTGMTAGLLGKTLGIIGLGRLGGAVAKIAVQAWGMNIIAWSSSLTQEKADKMAKDMGLPVEEDGQKTFKVMSKEDVMRNADVVSVHYVLSPRSKGIIDRAALDLMKPDAFLVNTSRGPLIDEDALHDLLEAGKIRGAALDVFELEPLPKDSKWRSTKWGEGGRSNLLLTPHMGYVEEEIMHNWYEETADNVERFLDGKELLNPM